MNRSPSPNRNLTPIPILLLLAAIGVPAAAVLAFATKIAQSPLLAVGLFLLYEVVVFAVVTAGRVWQKLDSRWSDLIAEWIAIRVSGFWYVRYYSQQLFYQHRDFDVKGLSTQSTYTLDMEQVLVELSIDPKPAHQTSPDPLHLPERPQIKGHSIWDYLNSKSLSNQHLVVIGAPGSGKTTLLKHIALTLVTREKRRQLYKGLQTLPILLFLRDHVTGFRDNPTFSLADAVQASIHKWDQRMPSGWVEQRLAGGRCLVLLDGLDEIADTEIRRQMVEWIQQQMVVYGKNRFVITSRPFGYRSNLLSGVTVLEMQPFTPTQVERFVHNWYLANEMMSSRRDDLGVRMKAKEGAEDLLQRLRTTPALFALAVNPLLLTMLATVHRYRGSLPNNRVGLYAEICEVFLGKRQAARGLLLEMTPAQKQMVLQPLAYRMMCAAQREISLADALITITEPLSRVIAGLSGEIFLNMIENSSGLVLEREPGIYSFAFLGLQEYLAALHIREQNLEHEITTRMEDSWWHETIYLYADLSMGKLSAPALRQAVECLRISQQHPEQTFILLDHFLRDRLEGALIWITRVEQREELATIARGFHQLIRADEGTTAILQNLRETLSLIRPFHEHYTHGHEVVVLLELALSCLECRSLHGFTSQPAWQIFETLEEPFLLPEMINFSRQLSDTRNQVAKYLVRTDRREKELLLLEMLRILERAEAFADQNLYSPYQQLALHISIQWRDIVRIALENQRGRVILSPRLLSESYPFREMVEIGLEVSNLGDETAEQVVLCVDNSDDYQIIHVDPPWDYLVPGARATLCCTLLLTHVRATRLIINLSYRQRGLDASQMNNFAYILTFFDQAEHFPFVPVEKNPYVTGNPLETDDVFFGREQLIADLASNLQGKYQDNPIVLYGQRRTGKTSLLYALKRQLPKEHYIAVFYDAAGVDSPLSLFWGLATQIYDACTERGIVLPQPVQNHYITHASAHFENDFLREVVLALGQRRLLLMIDEFESLEDAVKEKLLPTTIFSFLRKIMQHQRQFSFVFCGTHQLQELTRQYWQIFFNAALPLHVTFLDEEATKALIQEPVRGHFAYDELALMRMLNLTSGNPYFTQLLCHGMVSLVNKQFRGYVTRNEVDDVARQLIQSGNDHLDYIWNESEPSERAVLLSLTEETQQQQRTEVLWDQVEARLGERCPAERSLADEARACLERRELVANDGPRISFTMGLIPEWLIAHYTWSSLNVRKRQ